MEGMGEEEEKWVNKGKEREREEKSERKGKRNSWWEN